MASLHEHMIAVDSHPLLRNCDFKVAATSPISSDSTITKEVGFDCLSVRVVKELVTLGLQHEHRLAISDAGEHISAMEFHRHIEEASLFHSYLHDQSCTQVNIVASAGKSLHMDTDSILQPSAVIGGSIEDCRSGKGLLIGTEEAHKAYKGTNVVLLDVRNIYETRVGRFFPPQGVDFLDPKVRQYSDLPGWIDSNAEQLHNKCVLMYCTGGVRCEMASAYLKKKGKGFENVYQLTGGIQRYLEAFPDGGYFKGKNFVFDHRMAVASSCTEVIGSCMNCGISFDDYSFRSRCSHCRMLVLICSSCQVNTSCNMQNSFHICELCRVNRKSGNLLPQKQQLHECNFVNHSIMECSENLKKSQLCMVDVDEARMVEASLQGSQKLHCGMATKRRLKILCLHGFRQSASNLKGRLASFTKKLKHIAEFVFIDAPNEVPLIYSSHSCRRFKSGESETGEKGAETEGNVGLHHKRYAWLVTPDMILSPDKCDSVCGLQGRSLEHSTFKASSASSETGMSNWRSYQCSSSAAEFDQFQYRRQNAGWPKSFDKLKNVFSELGPFDGVLGFSQGAAVASSLCFLREFSTKDNIEFRFVILCSGFVSSAHEHQDWLSNSAGFLPLDCPSLHLFGDTHGCDRQISTEDSMKLVSLFKSDHRMVLKHNSGHIVPCQKEYLSQVKTFLNQFL